MATGVVVGKLSFSPHICGFNPQEIYGSSQEILIENPAILLNTFLVASYRQMDAMTMKAKSCINYSSLVHLGIGIIDVCYFGYRYN